MAKLGLVFSTCVGVIVLQPPDANADALGPVGVEAGAKVGAGVPLNKGSSPDVIPAMGFGLGGRAGVTLFNVYAGFSGVYYFGETKNLAEEGITVSGSAHTLMLGAEAGYDIKLLRLLTLRPQLGLGNNEIYSSAHGTFPVPTPTASTSKGYFYLEPALVGLVALKFLYVGADAGVRMLPEGPPLNPCAAGESSCHTFHVAFTAHGQVGVRF
jgi:hypothetical protein